MNPGVPKMAKTVERNLMTLLDAMLRSGKANVKSTKPLREGLGVLLQVIGLGLTMLIDSRSQGLEDRIRSLPLMATKKRGF